MTEIAEHRAPLDVKSLDRDLRALFERECRSSEAPLARTMGLNLIAVCQASEISAMSLTIRGLLERHPCRASVVAIDAVDTGLRAQLSMLTRTERGSRQLRLEQLDLFTSPEDLAKIPNLIRPLLVDDLPTQLYWATDAPSDQALLLRLAAMADQVVYDSGLMTAPDQGIRQLDALECPGIDLTWLRLAPWRHALAEAFETFDWDAAIPTEARIEHRPEAGATAAAIQLRTWLVTTLAAEVSLSPSQTESGPSMQPTVLCLSHGQVSIEIRHCLPRPALRVQITLARGCPLPFQIVASQAIRGSLLAAATDRIG